MQIYLDESGYTGPDLVNKEQPLFVFASHWISLHECKKMEAIIRQKFTGKEIKSKNLLRTSLGQSAIFDMLKILSENQENYAIYVVHKKCALIRKFVDDCIDPAIVKMGNEFGPANRIAYANLLSSTLPTFMGGQWYEAFLIHYNNFMRAKSDTSLTALLQCCKEATRNTNAQKMLSPFMKFHSLAVEEVNRVSYRTELHEQIIFGLIIHIRNFFNIKDFQIIIDNTKATTNESLLSFMKMIEGLPRIYKLSDVCSLHPDIKIHSTKMADSQLQAEIRIADILAGLANWTFKTPQNTTTKLGEAFLNVMNEKNFIFMMNSTDVTPESLGMSDSESPWE